jgi:outer membrane protein OmpA-like peptidoglycan-associated protein
MARLLVRVASVVAVGVIASACSSVPDWIDPTTWLSDKAPAEDGGKAPELADIPGKPPTTTPDDRKQVADSLAADRAHASYSAEQLRAGADQPLAPPPPAAPPPSTDGTAPPSKDAAKAPQDADSANPPEPEKKGNAMFEAAQGHAEAAAAPSSPDEATPIPTTTPKPAPASPSPAPTQQVAAATPPPSPTNPDSLGFQASSAPPPDPSVGQFVSPTLLNRYQQSASLNAESPAPASAEIPNTMSGGAAPAGIVYFAGDGTKLTPVARAKVREIAQAFQSKGASGFVRVVGHSSGGTPNMPIEQHQQLVFQRSQDRASAVARELIKDGVPAAKVLIEAVGDTRPKGEEGNRGTEIFLQS